MPPPTAVRLGLRAAHIPEGLELAPAAGLPRTAGAREVAMHANAMRLGGRSRNTRVGGSCSCMRHGCRQCTGLDFAERHAPVSWGWGQALSTPTTGLHSDVCSGTNQRPPKITTQCASLRDAMLDLSFGYPPDGGDTRR